MSEIRTNKIGNAAGTEAIDVTNVTGSNGITVNANGLISSGPQSGGIAEAHSSLSVGTYANGNYESFGSQLDTTNATSCMLFYSLINPRLIWLSFYIYKNSFGSTFDASIGWGVKFNIPNVKFVGGGNGAYQSINCGYFGLNSTNIYNTLPHRWQANTGNVGGSGWVNHNMLTMYGNNYNTSWTGGSAEFAGHGYLMLADAITS